jgi:purine-nucleoside phosphorylase
MKDQGLLSQIKEAADYIRSRYASEPQIGLILGSGLGVIADLVENAAVIEYRDIPHFPVSTVEGHAGQLLLGTISGKHVLLMKGRFHLYEGYGVDAVSFPVRVMKELGVSKIIVTNAAGGINTSFGVGDLMIIKDHINLTFLNPLIGPNFNELGVRFPDMSEAYSRRLSKMAQEVAADQGIKLQEGVYIGLLGPSYETPAEIRMLRTLGADAVGMSTVAEVTVARHAGIEVLGFSCITNLAAGILDQTLTHEEVMETTERIKPVFLKLILGIVARLDY